METLFLPQRSGASALFQDQRGAAVVVPPADPPVEPPVVVIGGGGGGGPVREVRAYAAQFDRVERKPKSKPKAKPPEPPKKKRWQDYLPS